MESLVGGHKWVNSMHIIVGPILSLIAYLAYEMCFNNSFEEYREWLTKPNPNYPAGGYDQDIFRFLEPKFYPQLKVDHKNLMAYRG